MIWLNEGSETSHINVKHTFKLNRNPDLFCGENKTSKNKKYTLKTKTKTTEKHVTDGRLYKLL